MSFSLQIQNGDLALSSGTSYGSVAGPAKLQQDLLCAILTPVGTDVYHPDFGSILEESVIDPSVQGIFGENDWAQAATIVRGELVRICQNYQAQQITRNDVDAVHFGKPTLSPNEVLLSVEGVSFIQAEDHLLCTLTLEVGNEVIKINVPVGGAQ